MRKILTRVPWTKIPWKEIAVNAPMLAKEAKEIYSSLKQGGKETAGPVHDPANPPPLSALTAQVNRLNENDQRIASMLEAITEQQRKHVDAVASLKRWLIGMSLVAGVAIVLAVVALSRAA